MKEAEGRTRSCTYCAKPGADVCVRMAPDGGDVVAHEACGRDHGVKPLYRLDELRLGAEHFG